MSRVPAAKDPERKAQQRAPDAEVGVDTAVAQEAFSLYNLRVHVEPAVQHVIEHAVEGEPQRIGLGKPPGDREQRAGPEQNEDEQRELQPAIVSAEAAGQGPKPPLSCGPYRRVCRGRCAAVFHAFGHAGIVAGGWAGNGSQAGGAGWMPPYAPSIRSAPVFLRVAPGLPLPPIPSLAFWAKVLHLKGSA